MQIPQLKFRFSSLINIDKLIAIDFAISNKKHDKRKQNVSDSIKMAEFRTHAYQFDIYIYLSN